MKSLLVGTIGVLVTIMTLPSSTSAWGHEGHQVVATIAQYFLSSNARNAVNQQLYAGSSLPNISTIPDYYDSLPQGQWSIPLHYVDDSLNATEFAFAQSCGESPCVVSAIYNFTAQLYARRNNISSYPLCENAETPALAEPCPLSFVVHFIGDVHQPMHVAYGSDQGGNLFVVNYFGTCSELHATWDYLMLDTYGEGTASLSKELIAWLLDNPAAYQGFAKDTNPRSWANESFGYARSLAYNFQPGFASLLYAEVEELPPFLPSNTSIAFLRDKDMKLRQTLRKQQSLGRRSRIDQTCAGPLIDEAYYSRNIRRVKQRLAAAGVRLARIGDTTHRGEEFDV